MRCWDFSFNKEYFKPILASNFTIMKPLFLSLLWSLMFINLQAQELTGEQLLDKTIQVHDPNGNWEGFKGYLQVTMNTPKSPERVSDIELDNKSGDFSLTYWKDGLRYEFDFQSGECQSYIDEPKARKEECEKTKFWRDYYTYLYGLPMKLKDQGTNIDSKVDRKTFKGKEYLVLKATYDQNVGSDVWFFYFDPATFKMEIYQFFKTDESGKINLNSGEYIVLSDNHVVNDINMPKTRKWYYNKDDQYLGTDVITK